MDAGSGRHVKAALALAGVTTDFAARELNISRKTLERTIRGERMPRPWETSRLAEVLRVPEWFLIHGLREEWDPTVFSKDRIRQARLLARYLEGELVRLVSDYDNDSAADRRA